MAVEADVGSGGGLLSAYEPPVDAFCEVYETPGKLREKWGRYAEAVDRIGAAGFLKRSQQAERMLEEHGATYNLFGQPGEVDRPWKLDLIPCLISSAEWQDIESALIQRARLMDAILKDAYAGHRMLKEGLLPAELLYANPGFLRPCVGLDTGANPWLTFLMVDIGRTVTGEWRVVGYETQAPNGLGFAVENRVVMSRVLSRVFHTTRVMRLAPSFAEMNEYLLEASFHNREAPTIALLSPGPSDRTYFEHAFLSRFLGYSMVESGDLTVRDNRVFMKTLGGLEPIDVILRWIADRDADPLALGGAPGLGVNGLIHAARTRSVYCANNPGAGILESPGLAPYLPPLARELLGEELALSETPTHWCGDRASMNAVLADLDGFVITPAFASGPGHSVDVQALSEIERSDLGERIRSLPYNFAAREKWVSSTIPTYVGGSLEPGRPIYRFFVYATRNGYRVMPGGLARVAPIAGVQSQAPDLNESISKDIWVLSEQPVRHLSLMGPLVKPREAASSGDLPSRAADNLLWLGRYLERAEGQARLNRSILRRLGEETPFEEMPELPVLMTMIPDLDRVVADEARAGAGSVLLEVEREVLESIFDEARPSGLVSTLHNVHRSATSIKDRLSNDSWRTLTRLEHILARPKAEQWIQVSETLDLMSEVLFTIAAFSGLAMESMTRGLGWRFMDMGRRLERATALTRLIRGALSGGRTGRDRVSAILEAVLEVADSSMTYRSRYRTYFQMGPALELLLTDEMSPRSLAFQFAALSEHAENLPSSGGRRYRSPEEKVLLKTLTELRLADIYALCGGSDDTAHTALDQLLADSQEAVQLFADQISLHFLTRVPRTQHFSAFNPRGGQ